MQSSVIGLPAIQKLSAVLNAVRVVDEVMPIQELACFLEVVKRDGELSIMELGNILGMAQSSSTRNIQAMTDLTAKKQPGLELVATQVDPMDMRKKYVHLTPKGRRLAEQISAIMQGGQ